MIRRTLTATFLNEVANHPDVRPYVGGEGVLDLAPAIENPDNIAIEAEHGGWLLARLAPSVYELHTMFLPEGRGKAYFAAAREALRYVFTNTDATEIMTKCPDDNAGARMAAAVAGFKQRFRRENAWAPGVGISYQAFTIDDWMMKDPEALKEGVRFHEVIEAEKERLGSQLGPHSEEDEAHNRAAGAAALIIGAGQVGKGVLAYNRWAMFAGYPGIAQVGPNLVDIGEVILEVKGSQMAVLLCR